MERRDVVGGGLLGLTALFGSAAAAEAGAGAQQGSDNTQIAAAVDDLRELLERRVQAVPELQDVRNAQRAYLRATQKYPDFIDVGLSVWERVYDWHIYNRVPPVIVRRDDGRYTMQVMLTTLVLRPEQADGYVSFAYDRQ